MDDSNPVSTNFAQSYKPVSPKTKNLTMKISYTSCFLVIAIVLFTGFSALAQQSDPNHGLKHWLTKEEALRMKEAGRNFVETEPPTGIVRNIAEFGPMEAVLVRYPFGIPMSLIKEMATDCRVTTIVETYSEELIVRGQYASYGVNLAHCNFIYSYTDTYWTRDYGPWFVTYGNRKVGIVDFKYNRPRPYDDDIPKVVADSLNVDWFGMNVIHTGGNYMDDDHGQSSSTTLVWDENPSQTHQQVADKMMNYLGVNNYMVVADPNNTYIDHIDCWGKFLDVDKVLIRSVPVSHPQYAAIEATAAYYASQISSYGTPFRVFRVNTPDNQPYTNSLILNKKVFVPITGSAYDNAAIMAYQSAMPGYQIIGITALPSEPWESTDALHCRAIGLADRQMLFIDHLPISGEVPSQISFAINAEIVPFSNTDVYADSTWIIYKVNGGIYDSVSMLRIDSTHWRGFIPGQVEGSEIAYYISATDASGKHATNPYIGAPDPHVFDVAISPVADITMSTDSLIYLTYEQMMSGQTATAFNYSAQDITIDYINNEGYIPFSWHIDPFTISLPHTLASGEQLDLTVKIAIPAAGRIEFLADTLILNTATGTHQVVILLDNALYSDIKPYQADNTGKVNVFPNPFTQQTAFSFELKKATYVRLTLYSPEGQLISTPFNGQKPEGENRLTWDGRDNNGNSLPTGIYIYRLQSGDQYFYGKAALMR
jgi:agmatine/peptidylarginine deiminase